MSLAPERLGKGKWVDPTSRGSVFARSCGKSGFQQLEFATVTVKTKHSVGIEHEHPRSSGYQGMGVVALPRTRFRQTQKLDVPAKVLGEVLPGSWAV